MVWQGVVALLTPASVDVLSHSAVRARNGGVVLATCFDAVAIAALDSLSDKTVVVTVAQACHRELQGAAEGLCDDFALTVPSVLAYTSSLVT